MSARALDRTGWHRARGADVCPSALIVPRLALEERVFGAIRKRMLVPEVVAYAVERALELVRAELAPQPKRIGTARAARVTEIDD